MLSDSFDLKDLPTSAVWALGDCPAAMESPHLFGKVKYLRCNLISRDSQSLRLCLKY